MIFGGSYAQTDFIIGDKIPKTLFFKAIHAEGGLLDITSSNEQITILDFFHTSCVTCIESIPKLMAVQKSLGNKVKIMMVTKQDKNTIEKFFKTNKFLADKNADIPMIVGDTLLSKWFRHESFPHVVFLKDNVVRAITHSDFIKSKVILDLLEKDEIRVIRKNDYLLNEIKESAHNLENKLYTITGYDDAKSPWNGIKFEKLNNDSLKATFNNTSFFIACIALKSIIKKPSFLMLPERVEWNVPIKDKYQYPDDGTGSNVWLMENGICYERSFSQSLDSISIAKLVINDLEEYFRVRMMEKVKNKNCLVIKKIDATMVENDAVPIVHKLEGSSVLAFLLDYSGEFPPTIDEADYKGVIEIGNFETLEELNYQLAGYGLHVERKSREYDIIEFRKYD